MFWLKRFKRKSVALVSDVALKHVNDEAWDIIANDARILAAIDPYMLGCAVGAYQRKLGGSLDFDLWWMCCKTTWIPKVMKAAKVSESALQASVLRFVMANRHRDWEEVMNEQVRARGKNPGITLKPGESVSFEISL